MREIKLNGYIDEEMSFGDEMTPESVRTALYGEKGELQDDVHITLHSYGGSVSAATRIHDEIAAYPGKVHITISGTAASAAVGLVMAADELDMTPGSMIMIHDPAMIAYGNVQDMENAMRTLEAAKESILNTYEGRAKADRETLSELMTQETWMDARTALEYGMVDAIVTKKGVENSAGERAFDREEAEKRVKAFYGRKMAAHAPRDEPETRDEDKKRESARERRLRLLIMER